MKRCLVYSYRTFTYQLIAMTPNSASDDIEILHEFEIDELKVAQKILNSLTLERALNARKAA